jgi:putative membrane protein
MIRDYGNHAANERTFLAWVRTAIAVIVFGFVIEKFNLFVVTLAGSPAVDASRRVSLERIAGPLERYEGLALMLGGIALLVVATIRFARTGRLLDDAAMHPARSVRAGLALSALLVLVSMVVLLGVAFSTRLMLG